MNEIHTWNNNNASDARSPIVFNHGFPTNIATGIHVITNTTQPSLNNFFDGGDFFDC